MIIQTRLSPIRILDGKVYTDNNGILELAAVDLSRIDAQSNASRGILSEARIKFSYPFTNKELTTLKQIKHLQIEVLCYGRTYTITGVLPSTEPGESYICLENVNKLLPKYFDKTAYLWGEPEPPSRLKPCKQIRKEVEPGFFPN